MWWSWRKRVSVTSQRPRCWSLHGGRCWSSPPPTYVTHRLQSWGIDAPPRVWEVHCVYMYPVFSVRCVAPNRRRHQTEAFYGCPGWDQSCCKSPPTMTQLYNCRSWFSFLPYLNLWFPQLTTPRSAPCLRLGSVMATLLLVLLKQWRRSERAYVFF